MATVFSGFDGTVDEVEDSIRSPYQGSILPVVQRIDALRVTADTSGTRTVTISAGVCWAFQVRASFDATSVTLDAVATSGQSRWDAVVVRRDWNANTVTLMKINGIPAVNAVKVLPAGVLSTPGDVHDQVLAMVQVTYNVGTVITEDRRMIAHKVAWVPTSAALPNPVPAFYSMKVVVGDTGREYRCVLNGAGVHAWLPVVSGWEWKTQSAVVGSGPGFTGTGLDSRVGYNATTGDVEADIQMRRTGVTLTPSSTGNFTPDVVWANLFTPYWPDRPIPIFAQYRSPAGAWYPCSGVLSTAGVLSLYSGSIGVTMTALSGSNDISIRAHIRFAREV